MYVKDRMTEYPLCITKDTSISKALDIMVQHHFHRLPVVDDKKLIGLVTESIITAGGPSQATSLSIYELNYLLSKSTVSEVMIRDVQTIEPSALLEEAAVKMRKNDVGCLVVVDRGEVVGIITQNDIFDAFVDLLGYYTEGARYVLEIDEDHPGILLDITKLFFNQNANITNLAVYRKLEHIDVVIRANNIDHHVMGKILNDAGYRVVSTIPVRNDE